MHVGTRREARTGGVPVLDENGERSGTDGKEKRTNLGIGVEATDSWKKCEVCVMGGRDGK